MDKMKFESANLTEKNIEKIAELFPNCITETVDEKGKLKKAINFEMLRAMLSEDIAEGDEAYEFTWVGKKAAIAEANSPIRKTLRPCPEESVDWDNTENLYIEGDNLKVLKLLQESYLGKVKMIYIDPPYNTGNDFIYRDDFSQTKEEYEEQLNLFDEDGNRLFKNTDSNGRFHSDWCSMMYSRLMLARNLLADDGVIFISIDEHEIENLRKCSNEIFGEKNIVGTFIWRKKDGGGQAKDAFVIEHEYIVVYKKSDKFVWKSKTEQRDVSEYNKSDEVGKFKATKLAKWGNTARREDRPSMYFSIIAPDNTEVFPIAPDGGDGRWRVGRPRMQELIDNNLIHWEKKNNIWIPYEKEYFANQSKIIKERSILYNLANTGDGSNVLTYLFEKKDTFENPKPVELITLFIECCTNDNDFILDFFSGSATTAHAVMRLNASDYGHRKFIMVQIPEKTDEKSEAYTAGYENICEIGKERIRRAGERIKYEIAEFAPIARAEKETGIAATFFDEEAIKYGKEMADKIDTGFRVFKLDETNMEDVYYTPAETSQQMLLDFENNIKPDRTDLDLLFGCLLEWGLPLSMPYSSEQIDGVTVHTYNNGDLIACFDKNIPESAIKTIAKRCQEYHHKYNGIQTRVVFRDDSFTDSPSKINISEIFKMISPDTSVKVI